MMKNGNKHLEHIIKCFKAYGFFIYQCGDIFQKYKGLIAIRKNVSLLVNISEIQASEFDIKRDIDSETFENLKTNSNLATCGLIVYSQKNDCYYRLPIEIIIQAQELKVRFITLTTLYSKAMETWRNL